MLKFQRFKRSSCLKSQNSNLLIRKGCGSGGNNGYSITPNKFFKEEARPTLFPNYLATYLCFILKLGYGVSVLLILFTCISYILQAIGAEYGEGFETFRPDGPLKVDVVIHQTWVLH